MNILKLEQKSVFKAVLGSQQERYEKCLVLIETFLKDNLVNLLGGC